MPIGNISAIHFLDVNTEHAYLQAGMNMPLDKQDNGGLELLIFS